LWILSTGRGWRGGVWRGVEGADLVQGHRGWRGVMGRAPTWWKPSWLVGWLVGCWVGGYKRKARPGRMARGGVCGWVGGWVGAAACRRPGGLSVQRGRELPPCTSSLPATTSTPHRPTPTPAPATQVASTAHPTPDGLHDLYRKHALPPWLPLGVFDRISPGARSYVKVM
jgi:hypothetical protein